MKNLIDVFKEASVAIAFLSLTEQQLARLEELAREVNNVIEEAKTRTNQAGH